MVDLIEDGDVGRFADFDNRYLRTDAGHGVRRSALETLPVVDVSPFVAGGDAASRRQVAERIRRTSIDIGFFYIVGHGIPEAEMAAFERLGRRFFELPLEEKMKIERSKSAHEQGFLRSGGLDPENNPDRANDIKERLFLNLELVDADVAATRSEWPDEALIPGFAAAMKDHIRKRTRLAQCLVHAFALSLGLEEDELDPPYANPTAILALNYYPPVTSAQLQDNQWSFSPHTDYGAFTLLQQDATGGLEVRNATGEWIDVPPMPGTFVVNIGDLFAMATNDLYTSNLHRAVNVGATARFSAAYFFQPAGDTIIECLRTCVGPSNPARYPPVRADEYLRDLIAQSNRTGRPGITVQTAQRFRKS